MIAAFSFHHIYIKKMLTIFSQSLLISKKHYHTVLISEFCVFFFREMKKKLSFADNTCKIFLSVLFGDEQNGNYQTFFL